MGVDVVPTDLVEAARLFRQTAGQGHADAQCCLGFCRENRESVETDLVEAARYKFRQAADQGHAKAQCSLGVCHEMGKGVEKNPVEAVRWYRQAAEQSHAIAQINLGLCYKVGWVWGRTWREGGEVVSAGC
jgi:TPR repeat protein